MSKTRRLYSQEEVELRGWRALEDPLRIIDPVRGIVGLYFHPEAIVELQEVRERQRFGAAASPGLLALQQLLAAEIGDSTAGHLIERVRKRDRQVRAGRMPLVSVKPSEDCLGASGLQVGRGAVLVSRASPLVDLYGGAERLHARLRSLPGCRALQRKVTFAPGCRSRVTSVPFHHVDQVQRA